MIEYPIVCSPNDKMTIQKSTTLQFVFSERQVELLKMLIKEKKVSQSDIIQELINRVLDKCEMEEKEN